MREGCFRASSRALPQHLSRPVSSWVAFACSPLCILHGPAHKHALRSQSIPTPSLSRLSLQYCTEVKALFKSLSVPATVVELDTLADGDAVAAGVAEVAGRRSVPQVFIGGAHVGGCDGECKMKTGGACVCGGGRVRGAAAVMGRPDEIRDKDKGVVERVYPGAHSHSSSLLSLTNRHRHGRRQQVGRAEKDAGGGGHRGVKGGERERKRERERDKGEKNTCDG